MTILPKNIGILSFLGPFTKNQDIFNNLGVYSTLIKTSADLDAVDALVIPGTEILALKNIIHDIIPNILARIKQDMPIFITGGASCILSKHEKSLLSFFGMKMKFDFSSEKKFFKRNIRLNFSDTNTFEAIFLRSPIIIHHPKYFQVVSRSDLDQETPVCLEYKNILICTFYPEFSNDYRLHEYFLTKI